DETGGRQAERRGGVSEARAQGYAAAGDRGRRLRGIREPRLRRHQARGRGRARPRVEGAPLSLLQDQGGAVQGGRALGHLTHLRCHARAHAHDGDVVRSLSQGAVPRLHPGARRLAPRADRAPPDRRGSQAPRAHRVLLRAGHRQRTRDAPGVHRPRRRARRVSRHTAPRLPATHHRAGADGGGLARAVRAAPSPRHRRAAQNAYRSPARCDQGAGGAGAGRKRRRAMKQRGWLIVAGLGAVAIALALFTLPANKEQEFAGYMEADLVLVGSEQGGRVETLSVEEGDRVKEGDPIFTLESSEQEAAVEAAKARVTQADAQLADAKAEVQRPEEIRVLEAALDEAKAMLVVSTNNLERAKALYDKGWTTKAALDDAIAQHDRNEAAVAEAEKRIAAARLTGRSDLIAAAAANADAARHALAEAEKNLAKRKVFAPAEGTVEEVYFRPGEVVNAGQAVIALLPPQNLKVRFF